MKHGRLEFKEDGLVYEPSIGCNIKDCIHECIEFMQNDNNLSIKMNFNGAEVTITKDSKNKDVFDAWRKALDDNAEAYRNSPEGKIAEAKEMTRLTRCQCDVDRLMLKLPKAMSSLDTIVRWLSFFSKVADHVDVKYDRQALIEILSSKYQENAHVGEDEENFTKQTFGEWIVGQAINCLKHGLPPHPITEEFAKQYRDREWEC